MLTNTVQVQRERSVLQAFCEYEDIAQNVYLYRPRRNPVVGLGTTKLLDNS
jgi:hypothetical protein